MRPLTLCFHIPEKEQLKAVIITITPQNLFPVKFRLEYELKKIRRRLKAYEKKKIIKLMRHRYPKVKNKKYKPVIKNLVYARQTMLRALKLLKTL